MIPVNMTPMHNVIVDHDWLEVNRVDFGLSAEDVTMRCADCGAERHILHTNASEETHQNQESEEETKEALTGISESLDRINELVKSLVNDLLDNSEYPTKEALIDAIAKRYNGAIDGTGIPFGWLKPWLDRHTHIRKRKVLLRYKQGPVCNRCDLIFAFDELMVDHIEADKSLGQLTNLQLLCKKCNGAKGNGPPSNLDVSPFKFDGKPCIHRVTCVEVESIRDSYENGRLTRP